MRGAATVARKHGPDAQVYSIVALGGTSHVTVEHVIMFCCFVHLCPRASRCCLWKLGVYSLRMAWYVLGGFFSKPSTSQAPNVESHCHAVLIRAWCDAVLGRRVQNRRSPKRAPTRDVQLVPFGNDRSLRMDDHDIQYLVKISSLYMFVHLGDLIIIHCL